MLILAHGETQVLPALLGIWLFFPVLIALTIWTLAAGLKRERNAFTLTCAVVLTVGGGLGAVGGFKDVLIDVLTGSIQWSEIPGRCLPLIFWGLLLAIGLFALLRMRRGKANERTPSVRRV